MGKVGTIIVREYLNRVKNRTFIISTLLSPLLMGLIIIVPVLAAEKTGREIMRWYVEDETGGTVMTMLGQRADVEDSFQPATEKESWYAGNLKPGEGYLVIKETFMNKENVNVVIKTREKISIAAKASLERKLNQVLRDYRMAASGLSPEKQSVLNAKLDLQQIDFVGGEDKVATAEVATTLGYFMGFLIYLMLVIYGASVMRGVVEEKSSRISEVMLSTVRPFQLMMGKIIGIGAAGLTQFILWIILFILITIPIGLFMMSNPELAGRMSEQQGMADPAQAAHQAQIMEQVFMVLNWKRVFLFIFYFLFGYLLYGALFAAVGSAVDQESDSQQLTWPVMIPLMIPMLLFSSIIQNPGSGLARFLSIFPLFSPTTMMVRDASMDVPNWEIALSMFLLVAGFIACVWVSARVYRVGILMYGKKVTLREIGRWILHS